MDRIINNEELHPVADETPPMSPSPPPNTQASPSVLSDSTDQRTQIPPITELAAGPPLPTAAVTSDGPATGGGTTIVKALARTFTLMKQLSDPGIPEHSDWNEDVYMDIQRAFASAMRLAEDDEQKDGSKTIHEHLMERMDKMRITLPVLDSVLEQERLRGVELRKKKDALLVELMDLIPRVSGFLNEVTEKLQAEREEMAEYMRKIDSMMGDKVGHVAGNKPVAEPEAEAETKEGPVEGGSTEV